MTTITYSEPLEEPEVELAEPEIAGKVVTVTV